MVAVYAWPPFTITGWALREEHPQSRSISLIGGRARTSSALRGRRAATAIISGIGKDRAGAGWVRMLNNLWAGGDRLVRVDCMPSLWHLYKKGLDLSGTRLEWVDGATPMLWTSGGTDMIWSDGMYPLSGVPVADGVWHGLTVTGLPPSRIVARPSELISVTDGTTAEEAMVLTVVKSDATGTAVIRTNKPAAFTVSGLVSIGHRENVVFEALNMPEAVQNLSGDFFYTWNFREVFEDEYVGGFTEVDPWT